MLNFENKKGGEVVTQGSNGHRKDAKAEDLTVFEPAFAPGDEDSEKLGYYRTTAKGDEGEIVNQLPQELTGQPPIANDEDKQNEQDEDDESQS